MRSRGARAVAPAVKVETVPAVEVEPAKEVVSQVATVTSDGFGDDIRPPMSNLHTAIRFADGLVLEHTDPRNWTLLERRGPIGEGANVGKYRWVELGYYPNPAIALADALRTETVKRLGAGLFSLQQLVEELRPLARGMGAQVEEQLRAAERQRGFKEGLERALKVTKDEKDKARIQELLDGQSGARR